MLGAACLTLAPLPLSFFVPSEPPQPAAAQAPTPSVSPAKRSKSSGKKESKLKDLSPVQQEFDTLLKEDMTAEWQWVQFNDGLFPRDDESVEKFLADHREGTFAKVELSSPETLSKLDEVTKKDRCAHWHWEQFCAKNTHGYTNPTKIPATVMEQFLAEYAAGSFASFEFASDLAVQQVQFLRSNGGSRQWGKYTRSLRDPALMPTDFVQQFLLQWKPDEMKRKRPRPLQVKTATLPAV